MRAPGDGDGAQEAETGNRDQHLSPRREHTNIAQAVIGFGGHERLRRLCRKPPALQRHDHRFFIERPRIGDRYENIRLPRQILAEKQQKTERGERPTEPEHAPNPFVFPLTGVPVLRPEEYGQFFLPVVSN